MELQDDVAETRDTSERRGGGSGRGNGEWQRQRLSGDARDRAKRGGEAPGERESVEGVAWLHQGRSGRSGKQEVTIDGRVCAGAPWAHALHPPGKRRKTTGEVEMGWAG